MSDLILYRSDDGQTRMHLRVEGDTVWLSQLEIAELFQTSKQNVSLHARNIFDDNELNPEATVKESLTVQAEGNFWRNNVDRMLAFNDQPILDSAGSVSREHMEKIARERFEVFDQQRRVAEARTADAADLKEIEQLEHDLKRQDLKQKDKKP
jgi:hypothetical protein